MFFKDSLQGSKRPQADLLVPLLLLQMHCLKSACKEPENRLPSVHPLLPEWIASVRLPLPPHRSHPTRREAQLLAQEEEGKEEEVKQG